MPGPAESRLPRHVENQLRVLAFGDSLTEGYTDFGTTYHPYGDALKAELTKLVTEVNTSVDIEGQSGDCVLPSLGGDFHERLIKATGVASDSLTKYDVTIILGGTNDLAYKMEAGFAGAKEIFEQGLKPLYGHVLATGSSLIVMTVPQRAIDTRTSNLAVKARSNREHLNRLIIDWVFEEARNRTHAASSKVWLFDLAPLVPFPRDKGEEDVTPFDEKIWSPDGLHMSASGYDFVGHELAAFVKGII
ncbi:hypothetical protein DOTSEDRAFT_75493 [Dothistroma septosporum NZE10]|uniref:SGNH hydrolase-type esterase domain-containing protein n=1 Tax=Dothistroma septosporum (strain NZE10 / CBS 128990) TaxID=675120 RepID=M2XH33_DOTSN|nr:hypothetical protein DOTSEDRAFT_75493 [Dothistroma septosporum NZE10]